MPSSSKLTAAGAGAAAATGSGFVAAAAMAASRGLDGWPDDVACGRGLFGAVGAGGCELLTAAVVAEGDEDLIAGGDELLTAGGDELLATAPVSTGVPFPAGATLGGRGVGAVIPPGIVG
jgi:hypothetical protein